MTSEQGTSQLTSLPTTAKLDRAVRQTSHTAAGTVPARAAGVRTAAEAERLVAALMQAPAVVCVTHGPEHVIDAVSELYVRAIGGRNVIGQGIAKAFPDFPADRLATLDKVFQTGEPYDGKDVPEMVPTGGAAGERSFNVVIQPLKTAEGQVYGLMIHAVDVTDDVRLRQELGDLASALERTNRELDSFAYAASHDLRAPLRGIANLAQWIEEDLVSSGAVNPDTREMLELMRVRMHRMEGLIEGLLQYSRAGRVHERAETVAVAQLVREVVDLISPPEGVKVTIASDMPTIQTEKLLLQQVFMNLIGNAVKHANRADPTIDVTSKRVGPFYEFSVRDNGAGIAPAYHDRIWGIFQTLESRDRVEGAGIGLALVKKIVESQTGRVWVESAPGDGAVFRFLWRK